MCCAGPLSTSAGNLVKIVRILGNLWRFPLAHCSRNIGKNAPGRDMTSCVFTSLPHQELSDIYEILGTRWQYPWDFACKISRAYVWNWSQAVDCIECMLSILWTMRHIRCWVYFIMRVEFSSPTTLTWNLAGTMRMIDYYGPATLNGIGPSVRHQRPTEIYDTLRLMSPDILLEGVEN